MPPPAATAPQRFEAGTAGAWWYALKPASWPKLLVPALLGQALGAAAAGHVDAGAAVLGLAFTVLDLAYVVLLNDWGDREVDTIKRRMFPDGCSPKTIPDGILTAAQVLKGGVLAGAGATAVAVAAAGLLDRPHFLPMGIVALAIFAAYTYRPVALNYRGGGELAEMIGVGFVLPWMQAYLQSGKLLHPAWWPLAAYTTVSLSSALASGLADEESDRAGGKNTVTTRFGNAFARRASEIILAFGTGLYLLAWLRAPEVFPLTAVLPPMAIGLWQWFRAKLVSHEAVTNAFKAQGRYKKHLHLAIWAPACLLSALVLIARALA